MNNIYRENGIKKGVYSNSTKDVLVKVQGSLYHKFFVPMGKTEKNVLLSMLTLIDDDLNTIQVGGDTLTELVNLTGYNEQSIRNKLRNLHPLIEKTSLRGEYIVNPLFAVKGSETQVWNNYKRIENELN